MTHLRLCAPAIAIALAVGLPFSTRIVGNAPFPQYSMEYTPFLLLMAGGLLIIALQAAAQGTGHKAQADPWLLAFAGWAIVRALWSPDRTAWPAASWIVLGVAVIGAARETPATWRPRAGQALAWLGGIEAALAILQHWTLIDPWTLGWRQAPRGLAHGTLGNTGFLGLLLAVTAPFAPGWALVVLWLPALVASYSLTGGLACAVGLGLRYRRSLRRGWMAAAIVLLPLAVAWYRGWEAVRHTALERVEFYGLGVEAVQGMAAFVGNGPGAWMALAMEYQRRTGRPPVGSALHSEAVQCVFELGLVGLLLAVGWCVAHRRAFLAGEWGGAMAAAAVAALTWFPFRIGVLCSPILLVIGMATSEGASERCGGD